jgi:hypothetical protein
MDFVEDKHLKKGNLYAQCVYFIDKALTKVKSSLSRGYFVILGPFLANDFDKCAIILKT